MLVRDAMTPLPVTVTLDESLQGAMELMAMKRIRHLPVVDASGKLIGLVSDRDLRRAAPSPLFNADAARAEDQLEHTTVERVMIRAPVTIGSSQRLQEAMKVMVEKKFGALPVVDADRLMGIITPIDAMKAWLKLQP
jgi:acetoin utilization protein AcuB